MKIAIVADPYVPVPPTKYGGTERVIFNLIKGLQEEGHEPILIGPADSSVPCEVIPTTPKSIPYPSDKSERPKFERQIATVARTMEAKIAQIGPRVDIIHSHSKIETGVNFNKFKHLPILTTLHNPIRFEDLPHYEQHSYMYYTSISRNQQEAFPSLPYVGVVYNGDDPSQYPIIEKPENYVCFLGRFDREKNPHMAIQLALSLGIRIKLAGKIDMYSDNYFEDEIEPYLNHPLVEYVGELDMTEKIELISKAMCNLHPTNFREPFGLAIMEAAYCGTPTLAVRKGSMPELIEEGRTGVLVEDMIEGYHRLQEVLEMDRLYIAKRARTLFNYRTMARQYMKAYETVLEMHALREKRDSILGDLQFKRKVELESIWQAAHDANGLI